VKLSIFFYLNFLFWGKVTSGKMSVNYVRISRFFFRKSYATKNYQICYLTDDRQIPIFAWPLANFIRFRFLSVITKRHCELLDRARVCINNVSCFIDDLVSRLRRFLRLGIVAFNVGNSRYLIIPSSNHYITVTVSALIMRYCYPPIAN
jgi:hypothetical protein